MDLYMYMYTFYIHIYVVYMHIHAYIYVERERKGQTKNLKFSKTYKWHKDKVIIFILCIYVAFW